MGQIVVLFSPEKDLDGHLADEAVAGLGDGEDAFDPYGQAVVEDHLRLQRKGHARIDGIAHQDFPPFEFKQIRRT